MKRSSLTPTAMRRKPTREPRELTEARKEVIERSGGFCEVVAHRICKGKASQVHHRKHRRHGDHRPVNLLAACSNCHQWIHCHYEQSYEQGLLVHAFEDPAAVPLATSGRNQDSHSTGGVTYQEAT